MLRELTIRDFVIVETVSLKLDDGFHVLTGETGAGKSILIDALGLVLGLRASADMVRTQAARADIQALFEPNNIVSAWLSERDLEGPEGELILRRVVDQQGKSRAYINGTLVTVAQLREIGEQLVDIHGQHAHQSLMRAQAQRDLLDAHCHLDERKLAVAAAWDQWQACKARLDQALTGAQQRAERIAALQWQTSELQTLGPREGEWPHLVQDHERLSNGQQLIESSAAALQAIDDDESGAQRTLAQAAEHLRQAARHDSSLQNALDTLVSAEIAVSEVRSDLSRYLENIELDPQRLREIDERMQALFQAARKYRCDPLELPQMWENLQSELNQLTQDEDIEALQQREHEACECYEQAAAKLRAARITGAQTLAQAVTSKMQSLGMPGARFSIDVNRTAPARHGYDQIVFMVASHESIEPGPVSKIASGGELSRIALALSVVASQASAIQTLVFDEVDSGVSGAVADMVGRLLRELGNNHQVLCVTHLPQVAASAEHHFYVRKQSLKDGMVTSSIAALDAKQRIEALAELLGGTNITATTRKHALEMLELANHNAHRGL